MKKIGELEIIKTGGLPSPTKWTRTPQPPLPPLPREWTALLFLKLKAIFLNRWTTQFHSPTDVDLAKQEWAKGLSGFSADEIERALDACRTSQRDWPPSIGQFRELARPRAAPCHKPFQRALPPPAPRPEIVSAALAKMRESLG